MAVRESPPEPLSDSCPSCGSPDVQIEDQKETLSARTQSLQCGACDYTWKEGGNW